MTLEQFCSRRHPRSQRHHGKSHPRSLNRRDADPDFALVAFGGAGDYTPARWPKPSVFRIDHPAFPGALSAWEY